MKKHVYYHLIFLFNIFYSATLFAVEITFTTGSKLGLRSDDLNWHIAGNIQGSSPNVFSELTWKNVKSAELNINTTATINKTLWLEMNWAYGDIFTGSTRDSDYLGDNRTFEFSQSRSNNNGDNQWGFHFGVGHVFYLNDKKVNGNYQIIPVIGFDYSAQNLRITDGFQTIPSKGEFNGLNSTYDTQWKSLWAGINFHIEANMKNRIKLNFQYHFTEYDAKADWNLRNQFAHPISFIHSGNGNGITLELLIEHQLSDHIILSMTLTGASHKIEKGQDSTFLSNATVSTTRLNEVKWESRATLLGIHYQFK